jgi:hypothetical protein
MPPAAALPRREWHGTVHHTAATLRPNCHRHILGDSLASAAHTGCHRPDDPDRAVRTQWIRPAARPRSVARPMTCTGSSQGARQAASPPPHTSTLVLVIGVVLSCCQLLVDQVLA